MKRKLLAVALMAASSLAAMSQSNIYTANVVGYVTRQLSAGYNFLANPLLASTNTLRLFFGNAPDGSRAYLWDVTNQTFGLPSTYNASGSGWDKDLDLPVGQGFVIYVPAPMSVTFVGQVLQGHLTMPIAGSNKFSLVGSKVPQGAPLGWPGSYLEFPSRDGANVFLYPATIQHYSEAFSYFEGFGWFDPLGVATSAGPQILPADSFFVQQPGPDSLWVRDFTVNIAAPQSPQEFASGPVLLSLSVGKGGTTLYVGNDNGAAYSVQFSRDRLDWTTVADRQTGSSWTGAYPGGAQGYYRLVKL